MALTIQFVRNPSTPNRHEVVADVTFDNSYPTGGESLTAADLGLPDVVHLEARQKGVGTRIAEYDYSGSKLKLFTALGTEAANASDQSAIVVRVSAFASDWADR
jgi:hypothetical protein